MNILDGIIRVKKDGDGFAIVVDRPLVTTLLATANSKVAANGIASAFKSLKAAIHAYQVVDVIIAKTGVKDEI